MAVPSLADSASYTDFFGRRVLLNVQYWRDYVRNKATDVSALDGERERIVTAILFALDLTEAWSIVYDLMVSFSPFMERQGHWEIWNQLLDRAINVAQTKGEIIHQTNLTALLARLLFQQSRFEESVHYYRRVIYLARSIDDKFNEGRACTNLGYYYIEQGHWYRAEVLCSYALKIFEQLDSDHGCAHTENHLGYLYTWQCLWDKARYHLERACAIWESMGDSHGLMRGLINLSALFIEMETPNEAILHLQKALYQATLSGEETEIGAIYENLSLAHRLKGEVTQAESYLWQAEEIFKRSRDTVKLARLWKNLARILLDQGKWQEATSYLENALQASRNSNNKNEELRILLDIAESELARGNSEQGAIQLEALETLIIQYSRGEQRHHLEQRLAKYRRSLAEHLSN